jgi:hypothetical protein
VAYDHVSVEDMSSENMANIRANIRTKELVFPMILVEVPLICSLLCPVIAEH